MARPHLLLALALAACAGEPPHGVGSDRRLAAPAAHVQARLVDSVPAAGLGMELATIRRVEVRGVGLDTIPGLLATDEPAVVGDSAVLGLAVDSTGSPAAMYQYSASSRVLRRLPLPRDLASGMSGAAVAPGGRWAAYVRFDGENHAEGVIRVFPNGDVIARSRPVDVASTDGRLAEAEWLDSGRVALYIDGLPDGTRRLRLVGTPRGEWRLDTVGVRGPAGPPNALRPRRGPPASAP
jgi:hypothetical protein